MAFASTVTNAYIIGNRRRKIGTYSNAAGDIGGSITTGLKNIESHSITVSSHRDAAIPQTTTTSGSGTITVVCQDDMDGTWSAEGL